MIAFRLLRNSGISGIFLGANGFNRAASGMSGETEGFEFSVIGGDRSA